MMKNLCVFFTLACTPLFVYAQPALELREVEEAFAALSKSTSARKAFLTYLSDSSVLFAEGEPVNGKDLWESRPADSALLFWWPLVTEVAASGDFGYNVGQFEFSLSRDAAPVGFGYFSTIWKKDNKGQWKVVVDMGATTPGKDSAALAWHTVGESVKRARRGSASMVNRERLMQMDAEYNRALMAKEVSVLPERLAPHARLHREGSFPLTTTNEISSLATQRNAYVFETAGADVASSGDMGYVYGRVSMPGDNDNIIKRNFLRVYRLTDGKHWKIVLDAIGN